MRGAAAAHQRRSHPQRQEQAAALGWTHHARHHERRVLRHRVHAHRVTAATGLLWAGTDDGLIHRDPRRRADLATTSRPRTCPNGAWWSIIEPRRTRRQRVCRDRPAQARRFQAAHLPHATTAARPGPASSVGFPMVPTCVRAGGSQEKGTAVCGARNSGLCVLRRRGILATACS